MVLSQAFALDPRLRGGERSRPFRVPKTVHEGGADFGSLAVVITYADALYESLLHSRRHVNHVLDHGG